MKAFITCTSGFISKFVEQACSDQGIETTKIKDESCLLKELKNSRPDMIFLQGSILEDASENIISEIKSDEDLGHAYIVVYSSRSNWADLAYQLGADAFLPIPFSHEQGEAVFRNAMQKPRAILIVAAVKPADLDTRLREVGFSVEWAKNGAEGLELARMRFPDMVICSMDLDDMEWIDFSCRLREMPLLGYIPMVVLIRDDDVGRIETAFEAGAQEILTAPYHDKENISRITAIVAPPKRGKKEKALVVDDSVMVRNIISKMFRQLGFVVVTAGNGLEGMNVARKEMPDIITSDYDMPVMDGWGFCKSLKSDSELRGIPVIMITSRDSSVDLKKGKHLGVSAYLPKPFKVEDLQKIVREVISDAKRDQQDKILKKYVAADTIQKVVDVIEGVTNKDPEEKNISILFSDICSFTAMCERLTPRQVVDLLNAYFTKMVEVLLANDAIIDKFIGDAIVARFDSGDHRRDALNAARGAVAMLAALNTLNMGSIEELAIRIGVNCGQVILGNIGSENYRLDYTMIGDAVNTAQRLESSAPRKGCLISKAIYEIIEKSVVVGERLELKVKNKAHPVVAYQLLKVLD